MVGRPRESLGMSQVLVIGAGPAGLATMACLAEQGVSARFVDRQGRPGGAYNWLHERITLSSPARWTSLPGLAIKTPGEYVTVAGYRDYLHQYARHFALEPESAEVTSLTAVEGGFEVDFGDHRQHFQAVVTATGMDGLNWPDPPLGPNWMHSSQWRGPDQLAARRLLIIGRGVSAVEIAEECCRAGLEPTVSCRGKVKFSPQRLLGRDVHDYAFRLSWLPRWLAWGYCRQSPTFTAYDQDFRRFAKEGRLRVRPPVTAFEGQTAIFSDGTRGEFDLVVCATGYRYAMAYLPESVARSPADGHPLGNRGQSINTPGLFLMGVHCARGVSSQFLRGMALDAPAIAATLRERLEAP